MGSKKRPFYRIVASDSRNPRDGRFLETLGYYNPIVDPPDVKVREDLVFKWMERGAVPTEIADSLLRKSGTMKKWSLIKQGASLDEVDAKVEALRATETQPISKAEREAKKNAQKAAVEAEAKAKLDAEEKAKAEAEAATEAQAAEAEAAAQTEPEPEPEAEPAEPASDEEKNTAE
jgi:small subunit ribosomal protein S16